MGHCKKCNSILKNYEGEVCNACNVCPLSDYELQRVAELTEKLENQTLADTGVYKLSGGFAKTQMFDYDDLCIDIELTWGVEGESTNSEKYTIDRTEEIEDWCVENA